MASVSWTSTTGGDWSTGANWSGDAVPVASSEVTISTANSLTVTYSHDTSTIVSLETNVGDLFYMTGGALDVGLGIALGGGFAQSGGSLEVEVTIYRSITFGRSAGRSTCDLALWHLTARTSSTARSSRRNCCLTAPTPPSAAP